MSDLVVIEFPSEAKAEEVRQRVLDMQKDYLIELGDAVIAVKQPNGRVKLNQLLHPAAAGAAMGTMWGTLIGLIFLMPLLGAAVGAASGAVGGALTDVGIDNRFMKDVAASIEAGNAEKCCARHSTTPKRRPCVQHSRLPLPASALRPDLALSTVARMEPPGPAVGRPDGKLSVIRDCGAAGKAVPGLRFAPSGLPG